MKCLKCGRETNDFVATKIGRPPKVTWYACFHIIVDKGEVEQCEYAVTLDGKVLLDVRLPTEPPKDR